MKRKRSWFMLILFPFLFLNACSDKKTLDLGTFEITVPKNWEFKPIKSFDSNAGFINSPGMELVFDYSVNGFAAPLLETEKEYLQSNRWVQECFFCKDGITYTSAITGNETRMIQVSAKDTTKIKAEGYPFYRSKVNIRLPTSAEKNKFSKADYIADITFRDSTIHHPIEIPAEIKAHHIVVDTTAKYIIKTIWPKVTQKGMTGVYIHSRKSYLNFMMDSKNLSLANQQLALAAFKTIKFK